MWYALMCALRIGFEGGGGWRNAGGGFPCILYLTIVMARFGGG